MSIYMQGIIFLIAINLISVLGLSLLTGFTGSLMLGDDAWDWDVNYIYSRNQAMQETLSRGYPQYDLTAIVPGGIAEFKRASPSKGEIRAGEIQVLVASEATVISERRRLAPWGLAGGAPGEGTASRA